MFLGRGVTADPGAELRLLNPQFLSNDNNACPEKTKQKKTKGRKRELNYVVCIKAGVSNTNQLSAPCWLHHLTGGHTGVCCSI